MTSLIFIFCFCIGIWFAFFYKQGFVSRFFFKPYAMTLELDNLDVVEEIEMLLVGFRFKMIDKILIREDDIRLELRYRAHPIAQHLFLKRVYMMPDLGKIVCI